MAYIGNPPAERFTSFDYQDLTGGTGTSFTLTHPVGNAQEILVMVNNVVQEPGVAYTVSGTGLTMTGSIAAADDFYVVYRGKAIQTATHPSDRALTATDGTFTGDLTVDTNTLHVDATDNSVGVGTTSLITASGRSSLTLSTAAEKGELHLQNRTATTSSDAGILTYYNGSNRIGAIQGTADGATDKGKLIFMALDGGSTVGRMDLTEHGLTFNGDTAAANALDDYEVGTWTAGLQSSGTHPTTSSLSAPGNYVKIGDIVHASVYIVANFSNTGTGNAKISGLPFTLGANASEYWPFIYVHGDLFENDVYGGYGVNNDNKLQPIKPNVTTHAVYRTGTGVTRFAMLNITYRAA